MTHLHQKERVAAKSRSIGDPVFLTVGALPLDLRIIPEGKPTGNKHPARFAATLGGAAVNAGRFGPVNGFPTAVLAAQQTGWASSYCRELAQLDGLRLLLQERNTASPGLSVLAPNGRPGLCETFTGSNRR